MNTQAQTKANPSAIQLANSLNWGIYRSAASAELIQEMHDDERKMRAAVNALKQDLPVDEVKEEKKITWGIGIGGAIAIPPKEEEVAPEAQQTAPEGENAAESTEPPSVPETAFAELLNFSQAAQQVISLPKPSEGTRMLLSSSEEKAQAHEIRDWIYTELQYQQSLLQNSQRGLNKNDSRKLAAVGIQGKLMSTDVRSAYAEAMEKAFAASDVANLEALKARIAADYPRG